MISLEHLEECLSSAHTDIEKIEALNTLAHSLKNKDLVRCKLLADESLQLIESRLNSQEILPEEHLAYQNQQAESLWLLGFVEMSHCNYQQSLKLFQNSLEIFQTIADRLSYARVLLWIGNVLSASGEFKKSIEYCTESFAIYKAENDQFNMA